jgi:tetratricopeptide (TPR) repeat protein
VIEDTMFFPKLRRHAKWMFVFLAVVFAGGFVVFGVGSDVQGGIGDIFRDQGATTDAPSVQEARERVAENPNSAEALRELATALSVEAETDEAITVLTQYTELRPKDEDSLRELAGLYLTKANRLQIEAEITQQRVAYLTAGAAFSDPLQLPNGTPLQDPIVEAVSTKANAEVNAAYTAAQNAFRSAADAYDKVVALAPSDPNIQLELAQTAQRAGDFPRAIAAYERFVELAPDDPNTAIVKRQIKQLEALGQTTVGPSG